MQAKYFETHFSIIDNKPLVQYLKNKLGMGSIEVQHGLSHYISKDGRWEFGENSDKKQNIYLGRNILRKEKKPRFYT
jgi:hypothetical protein